MSTTASTLKLPEFQPTSPATWLLLCESTFAIKKVSKPVEKFHHAVAALPASVAVLLRDVLTMGPVLVDGVEVDQRWERLKERLNAMYALNDFEAYQRIVDHPSLSSSQKPSQLLSSMMALVPDGVTPCQWMFKNCFLSKLPQHLRAVCRAKEYPSLMQMALAADGVMDINGSRSSPSTYSAAAVSYVEQLPNADIDEAVSHPVMASFAGRDRQLCWYHSRFGRDAQKCNQPCHWSKSDSSSNNSSPTNTRPGNASRAVRR